MPKFSILATDYEKHVPRDKMKQGIQTIGMQTFRDFELIICHDGPKEKTYEEEGVNFKYLNLDPIIMNTNKRNDDWGHTSRDKMLRIAKGDWIIHFNIDNILYPFCLEQLSEKIDSTIDKLSYSKKNTDKFSVIFYIKHWKIDPTGNSVFKGIPPKLMNTDLLQMVISRKIWEEVGYWYNRMERSDGIIYEEIGKKYPWIVLPELLGENF
jgi:hypothetical protein